MKGWTILPKTGILNGIQYRKGYNQQRYRAYDFAARDLFAFIERGPLFAEVETPVGANIEEKQHKRTIWFTTDKLIVHDFHRPTFGLLKHLLSQGADPSAFDCALIKFLAVRNHTEILQYIFRDKKRTFFNLGDTFHLTLADPALDPETLGILLKNLPIDDSILDRSIEHLRRQGNTTALRLIAKYAPPGYRPPVTKSRGEPTLVYR